MHANTAKRLKKRIIINNHIQKGEETATKWKETATEEGKNLTILCSRLVR